MELLIGCAIALAIATFIAWVYLTNHRLDRKASPEERKDLHNEVVDRMAEW